MRGEPVLPRVEEHPQLVGSARLTQRFEELHDPGQRVSAATQLPRDLGVPHTVRPVRAISGGTVAVGTQDAFGFPGS